MTTISDQDLKAAVAKAVLETLDQNKRDLLIQNALENLMAPRKSDRFSSDPVPSVLQETFSNELSNLARDVVRGYFTEDGPMKKKLRGFIEKMVEKMLTDESGELGEAFANTISEGLRKSLARY